MMSGIVLRNKIKKFVIRFAANFVRSARYTEGGRYFLDKLYSEIMNTKTELTHNGLSVRFVTPNKLCCWRVETFSTKEPETLEWIDQLPEGSIIWDVGANIGLYSIYAAKKRNCRVWAFEPSIFNLEMLARNIYINGLIDQICIVPLALSESNGASSLRMTTTEVGGALSTFGQEFGWDGNKIDEVFEFQTLGISMDEVISKFSIPLPDYIKMDVDGLEHFILRGGNDVLQNISGILIEINDDFTEQSMQCRKLLNEAGLVLKKKGHSMLVSSTNTGFSNCYNQIWSRS